MVSVITSVSIMVVIVVWEIATIAVVEWVAPTVITVERMSPAYAPRPIRAIKAVWIPPETIVTPIRTIPIAKVKSTVIINIYCNFFGITTPRSISIFIRTSFLDNDIAFII